MPFLLYNNAIFELFQILNDDAVKVPHSICQQIWKTQQWPQDWKRSVFIPIQKKGNAKECSSQFSSVAQSCPTLCDPMNHSTPGLPVHYQLPEFTQTQVYWVGDAIQPSHPLLSPFPPALNPSQDQSFSMSQLFAGSGQSTVVSALASFLPKNTQGWSLYNGLVGSPCRPRDSQEYSPTTQFKTINSLVLSFLHSPTLNPYMITGKNIALSRWTFVGKVISLHFNMLSRLAITFLLRIKCLLISRLQSPSAVILEPLQNTVWHCFQCFPIYFPWSDGNRCHDLSFLNVEL